MISDTLVPLGKMKTGVYDAPSAVDVMQDLIDDMQLACNNLDYASVDHIHRRYLSQMNGCGVEMFGRTRDPSDRRWTLSRGRLATSSPRLLWPCRE